MGVYDQAARYAAESDPKAVVRRVLRGTSPPLDFQVWRDTRTSPRPGDSERTADRVAELVAGDGSRRRWLLILEFQSRHDPDKLDVTLVEAGQLRLRCRYGVDRQDKYNVLTALVYLQGACPEPVLDMTLPEGAGTRHAPLIWVVAMDSAREVLEAVASGLESWGMLFWVALMHGGGEPDTIRRWRELASALPDRRVRGDLGKIALTFAELAGCAPAWRQGLEGWDMTESPYINSLLEGPLEQARLESTRGILIRVLRKRFPSVLTPDVMDAINAQPSLSLMNEWLDAAIDAYSQDAFLAVLRK